TGVGQINARPGLMPAARDVRTFDPGRFHSLPGFRSASVGDERTPNVLSQTPQGISKISTCLAMPRSERFSGVAAMPFDCNSFEASLSVTTRLVAKMERDVASPWTRAAIFTVRPK